MPLLVRVALACNNARLDRTGDNVGDPTEIALLLAGEALGARSDGEERDRGRLALYHFHPRVKLMSTVDAEGEERWLHTKGAPEAVLERCDSVLNADGDRLPLANSERDQIAERVKSFAAESLRVIALAGRQLPQGAPPDRREQDEHELCLLGLITMEDAPREAVADAVAACHSAGIRIHVITGTIR